MDQQRFFLTRGSLKYAEPLDIRAYVDDSFVDYAVQRLGPARP